MTDYQLKSKYKSADRDEILSGLLLSKGRKDIIFFAEYFLGVQINSFQKRYLSESVSSNSKQNILVTGNQVGKTMALAILHIYYNFYKIGLAGEPLYIDKAYYQTLNISPISRQAKECFRYIEEVLTSSFSWEGKDGKRYVNNCRIKYFYISKNENLGKIDFSNNTCQYSLSTGEDKGASLQGAQFALITYDEAPVSHHLKEELPARIFSRTAKYNGRIDLIGTPDEQGKSQQYWFHLYSEALKGVGGWKLFVGIYDENEFIPEHNREEFKKRLKIADPIRYEQVILGKFITSSAHMFSSDMIEALWNGKEENGQPQENREYCLSVDWGMAEQGDETVMLVGDVTDFNNPEVLFGYSKQGGDPVELMAMVSYLQSEWNNAHLVMDTGGLGGVIMKKMLSKLKPVSFGKEHKPDALFYLQMRLKNNLHKELTIQSQGSDNRLKSVYFSKLESQLSAYKIEDTKLEQDWVMALAMFNWFVDKRKKGLAMKSFSLKM